jgi:hypothetical protein
MGQPGLTRAASISFTLVFIHEKSHCTSIIKSRNIQLTKHLMLKILPKTIKHCFPGENTEPTQFGVTGKAILNI